MNSPGHAPSVMVVDDTPANLKLLDDMLRRQGYRVLQFPRGALALRAAQHNPPDLILLDVMMPDMDGFEVCRQLKSHDSLRAVPVIFISALTDSPSKVKAFAAGAVDYVSKPFQEEEVLARVGTHLKLFQMQRHLQDQKQLLETLVQQRTADLMRAQQVARVGSWTLDMHTHELQWSAQTYRMFGVPLSQTLNLELMVNLVFPPDRELFEEAWLHALRGAVYDVEHRVEIDGQIYWMRERAEFELNAQGEPIRALGTVQDITESKADALALDNERLRLQNAVDAARAGTWEWEVQSGINRYNARAAAILGYEVPSLQQGSYQDYVNWIHPDDRALEQRQMQQHLRGELPHYEAELRLLHRDGHYVWCRSLGRVMQRDASGKPLLVAGICVDISEQKNHREHIDYITHHDALTGLPNRNRFVARLAQTMVTCEAAGQRLGVAYLDLDGFSAINETHGRELGSQLIVEVSRRLVGAVADGHYLAHIGGDEFAVILQELSEPDVQLVPVKRLLDAIARPLNLMGLTLHMTASLGLTLYPQQDKVDAEQLLRQADQAMYLAKLAGKNRLHLFDPVNDESTRERFLRIDEIRLALLRQEFVLYYQPKVHLSAGNVIGYEALIRWQHPQQGLLAPGLFIPALDRHPLAIALGDWVIEAALRQLALWKSQGLNTRVSVNIDSQQLHDPEFADRLQRQLAAQPTVLPCQLELEILETGALENMQQVSTLIRRLQDMGIECALDDFGTGYSSLTFLKQLAAHTIKIDQSFVRGMLDDAEHAAIVNSILGLARNFDRIALAEGIETEAMGQTLIEFGCQFGQGYAIARPMPAAAVLNWLTLWQPPLSWTQANAVSPRDIPVLLAEVEHRAWLAQVLAFARHRKGLPTPDTNTRNCRFSHWLNKTATQLRFAESGVFAKLTADHAALHQQAHLLVACAHTEDPSVVAQGVLGLQQLSDALLTETHHLRQQKPHPQWENSGYGDEV
jgi:diguanylate cyclase (GGDEF)-like protein/PAS domain S-box-containing protein